MKKKHSKRIWNRLFKIFLCFCLLALLGAGGLVWYFTKDLPPLRGMKDYKPLQISRILDQQGVLLMELALERRTPVAYKDLPKKLVQAFVASEDAHFFQHSGIDYSGILRAFWKNLWKSKGSPKQGGSTISQQVVKTFLFSPKQTYSRKIKEAFLTKTLEQNFSKEEILTLYLNQIYFGRGRYGVSEAARYYFKKKLSELTLPEAAIIAGIPKNPDRYNPVHSIPLTAKRRDYVLRRMYKNQFITQKEYKEAIQTPVTYQKYEPLPFQKDYYTEEVRKRLKGILSKALEKEYLFEKHREEAVHDLLYKGGLVIKTAMISSMQQLAKESLQRILEKKDQAQGLFLPLVWVEKEKWIEKEKALGKQKKNLQKRKQALVLEVKKEGLWVSTGQEKGLLRWKDAQWARKQKKKSKDSKGILKWKWSYHSPQKLFKAGHLLWVEELPLLSTLKGSSVLKDSSASEVFFRLWQPPTLQGAIMIIDSKTRGVRAMLGGYDFKESPFNRATQSQRQPGSSFKPIVYGSALDSMKFTPSSRINDTPFSTFANGKKWSPMNYDRKFLGKDVSLRYALTHSLNSVAVRVLDSLGIQHAIDFAKKLGIESPLAPYLPLALGSSGVRLSEMTNAYATFSNQGSWDRPIFITSIEDSAEKIIYERLPSPKQIIPTGLSYILTDMMSDVVQGGTAVLAKKLKRPVAGKTGTTNDYTNAWFVGYTPNLTMGVWVGHDDRRKMGRGASGGRMALPVFVDFFDSYYKQFPEVPVPFPIPEDVVFVQIDPQNGHLSSSNDPNAIFEVFLPNTQPKEYAPNKGDKLSPDDFKQLP